MQKESCKNIKHAKIKQYEISYEIKSDYEMSLSIINTENFSKYTQKNAKLNNINCRGIEEAFSLKNNFEINFEQLEKTDTQDKPILRLLFTFTPLFLIKVSQILDIPFKSKVSQVELFKSKADHISKRLQDVKKQNQLKYQKTYKQVQSQIFKSNVQAQYDYDGGSADYDIKQFVSIQLPQFGKYKIQVSMFVKSLNSPYLFIYTSRAYTGPFPSGGMMLPVTNNFIPISISYIFDNRTSKQTKHEYFSYDIIDYPFEVRNFIMTATRIQ